MNAYWLLLPFEPKPGKPGVYTRASSIYFHDNFGQPSPFIGDTGGARAIEEAARFFELEPKLSYVRALRWSGSRWERRFRVLRSGEIDTR